LVGFGFSIPGDAARPLVIRVTAFAPSPLRW
jgi:hypothetical protein